MSRYINVKNGKEALDEIVKRLHNDVYERGCQSLERFEVLDDEDVYDHLCGFQYDDRLELKLEKEGDHLYLVYIYARSRR